MAGIQCKVDIPKVAGLEDQQLTVGREFYLVCQGEWPRTLKQDQVSFLLDPAQKYEIELLKFEFTSPTQADIKVSSYLAGPHQFKNLVLTDGEQKIELGPVDYKLESVLTPGEKVEPYGPMGPASIPIPVLYWILLGLGLGLIGLALCLKAWRYNQRKEMLARLKEHDSALSPILEFHQSMRKLQRGHAVFYGKEASAEELQSGVQELARMFKVYLSRQLKVPAFEWSERLVLKDIRKYHPAVYLEHGGQIRDLFTEFKKAQATGAKLLPADVVQLSQHLRKTLEKIQRQMERES